MLAAIKKLINEKQSVHLTISGPLTGDILPVLNTYENLQLGTRVQFMHVAFSLERARILKNADAFIFSSTALETFGVTVIEALAAGIPVVGFRHGEIPAILCHVDKHLVAHQRSANSLAKSIRWIMSLSDENHQHLRARCLQTVQNYYSDISVRQKIISIYETKP
jgi:glycosyltransferase involved in cell wall biosynthesis